MDKPRLIPTATEIGTRYSFFDKKGKRVFPDEYGMGYRTIAEAMDAYYRHRQAIFLIRERMNNQSPVYSFQSLLRCLKK